MRHAARCSDITNLSSDLLPSQLYYTERDNRRRCFTRAVRLPCVSAARTVLWHELIVEKETRSATIVIPSMQICSRISKRKTGENSSGFT